ncbi:MAG TPA: hypothetical protein VJZ93_01060 [Candidatus Nanoarchaeia archaeon]|nr:hypothetical protein [Candidatus Nanoarchaeia archaeon]
MVKIFSNRRGWIRIVEAFLTILLIVGVVFIFIEKDYIKNDSSETVYNKQQKILREIQLNSTLRSSITSIDAGSLPLEFNSFPSNVRNMINSTIPSSLECTARICEVEKPCNPQEFTEENIYAQSIIIAASLENYNPVKLNLFCREK